MWFSEVTVTRMPNWLVEPSTSQLPQASNNGKVSGILALRGRCAPGRATRTGGSENRITGPGKRMINIIQGPGPQSRKPGPTSVIPNNSCQKEDLPCQVTLGLGTGLVLGLNVDPTIVPP